MELDTIYRQRFNKVVLACKPDSILDVGCGEGDFLAAVRPGVSRATGAEVAADAIAKSRQRGLEIVEAGAESLPFADREFDLVVSQYVAHHLRDLDVAMREMLRVARLGVLVLDVWYDATVPAQATMLRYDAWSKRIDEEGGKVHRPVVSARQICGPLLNDANIRIGIEHWLVHQPIPRAEMQAHAKAQLKRSKHPARDTDEWRHIEAEGASTGFGAEGVIVVTLLKSG